MERSEIRNVHPKSMLSERCSEPNASLEAMIKETQRRGQPRPSDTMAARWCHLQTPEHLRKTQGSSYAVVALQRAYGIDSPTKEQLPCIGIFLHCRMGKKDRQFVLTMSGKQRLPQARMSLGNPTPPACSIL